ncbi:MAG: DUF4347 domain-containing protein, partial [Magnetococcales bacterium]|nr:DUF4347 domain-containing protein [Magnetococcales bacterium]
MANYWLENVFGWFFPPDPKVRSHAQQRAAAFSQFLPLEQRLMFEGVGLLSHPDDPLGRDSHDAMHDSTDPLHHAPDPHHDIVDNLAQALSDPRPLPGTNPQRTILFVDSRVPDLKHFLKEASPNLQVVVLDAQQDGVQHMATILDKLNTHFDAIQIVSHLNKDHVEIGGTTLSDKTIDTYQKELQIWGKSLNNGGSIQIYDAGSDTKIPTFIDKLAKSAGAEVVVSPYARVDLANTGITTSANRELVVIDPTVTDIPTLIGDLTRQAEVLLLDPNRDGFSQIAAFMSEHTGEFSALHVVSHGSEGSIKLGSAVLDNSTLDSRQNVLKEWSQGLTAHADLLLYGCDVAQGTVGKEFVARLAEATKTHVAASDDRTGDAAKGGDWILEDHVGSVVTPVIINATSGQNYHDTLATYTVTNLNDSGAGSLRQAISSANANAGDDDIVFTNGLSGNINLSSTITINDANNLTINGDTNNDSVADITIEGNGGNYKAFSVTLGSSTKTLTLQSININNFAQTALTGSAIWLGTNGGYLILNDSTISNCSASSAGAILANNGTHITLNRDILTGNSATGSGGSGGAIVAAGASVVLTINNCTISSNTATVGVNSYGGGITSMFATTTINDSIISNNSAYGYAGVYISSGTATIERCTIDSNSTTTGDGGGVGVVSGGTLLLYDSTISYNSSAAAGGGVIINSGSGTIDNCTFYGNSGSTVGGIHIASSTVTITNSTIANNTGTSQTGGISLNASATVNLANDIIANNTVGGVESDIDNTSSAGGVINANYCLIKDLTSASINTSTSNDSGNDPSLGALQNNGGTTWTMALGANSVAKDRWTAAQLAVYDTRQSAIDQRGTGYARVANSLVDIGAFEDQLPVATAGGSMAYVERAVAAAIDNTITVSDVDDTQSTGATVTISFGLTAGDVLDVATQNGISGSFNAATGVLTLTGTATLAQYQTALRSVTFSSTSHAPTATSASRTITWRVQDGSQSSTGVTSSISITAVNDAPSGTNTTITTLEDTPYTFTSADFGFSDSNDNPANSFLTVQITTLPAAGTLTNNGAAVNAGDWITQAEIIGGKLIFTPVANANGAGYTSFTFQVQDDGGILNGGIDLDPTPRTMTIDVTSVNDAPVLTGNATLASINAGMAAPGGASLSTLFNSAVVNLYSDVDLGSSFAGLAIVDNTANATTEGVWQYTSDGIHWADVGSVAEGATALALSPGTHVRFLPVLSFNGVPTPLSVRGLDNTYMGGYSTTNAGESRVTVDTSTHGGSSAIANTPVTLGTFINPPNNTPSLTGDATLSAFNEDTAQTTATITSLFSSQFSDIDPGSSLGGVAIVANTANAVTQGAWQYSPDGGTHWYDVGNVGDNANALAVSAASLVRFSSVTNYNGTPPTLSIRGLDNTYAGGFSTATRVTLDTSIPDSRSPYSNSTNTIGVTINSVNDAPSGTNKTVTILEDGFHTFAASDFGFTDVSDTPANALNRVKITTLPIFGALTNNGVAVTIGSFIPVADITGNKLVFTPAPNDAWSAYTSFTFKVEDDGGTANGGVNLDPVAKTITIDVTPVNDAPSFSGNATLASVGGVAMPSGATVNALFLGLFVDVDWNLSFGGLAIVGNTADSVNEGAWQYSSDGINWYNVGAVTDTSALMVGKNSSVRFVQVSGYTGTPTPLTVRAVDTTYAAGYSTTNAGQTRSLQDASVNGGSTPIAATTNTLGTTISVTNNAPSMLGNPALAQISEDTFNSPGNTVANLMTSLFSDIDAGSSLKGVAIVANASNALTAGSWQYSSNGGTDWFDVGVVADNANALALSSTTLLRFVPVANFSGSTVNVQIRPLDDTYAGSFSTTNGTETRVTVDTSSPGGSSAIGPGLNTLTNFVASVNDAPVNTLQAVTATLNEDSSIVFNAANTRLVTVSDVIDTSQVGSNDFLVTVVSASHGIIGAVTGGGSTVNTNWTGNVTIFGTAAQVNAALNAMVYIPNSNYNGTDTLSITTNDAGNTGGGALADVDTIAITINAVNDAPVNTLQATTATLNEDGTQTFNAAHFNVISVSDANDSSQVGGVDDLATVVNVTHGTLTVTTGGGALITNNTSASVTIAGTSAQVNAALNGMVYTPTANYNGADTLTVTTNDLGNTGSGGVLTDIDTIAITVNPVNDAPVLSLQSATASLNEDDTLVFDATHVNLITVNDAVDTAQASGVDSLSTTVSVTHGTLTATLSGATLTNNTSASVTIAGTTAQVNAALAGLIYTPNADYNGSDTLTIASSDLGNTGIGGVLTTSNTIAITVNPVNDAPVNTLQAATASLNEDATLVFDAAHTNLITVNDTTDTSQVGGVDSLSTTVSVTHGTLTATLSGATLTNNGTGSITIAGIAAQVNA